MSANLRLMKGMWRVLNSFFYRVISSVAVRREMGLIGKESGPWNIKSRSLFDYLQQQCSLHHRISAILVAIIPDE